MRQAHRELREQVRRFLDRCREDGLFTPAVDAWHGGHDPAFSRRLAEAGLIGMTLPAEYGGHGRTATERYVATEELLTAGAPVAAHWVADRQAGPAIVRYGTEEQKRRFIPPIVQGESLWAIGMSEPDAGSDLSAVKCRADRVPGGWVLNGTKVWTSHAHRSHFITVLCRTSRESDRHAGLSQFVVNTSLDGIDVRPIITMGGTHHFNEVVFDGVRLGEDDVLGEIGKGWEQVTSELTFERSGPERFLSSFLLLEEIVLAPSTTPAPCGAVSELGHLAARLISLRELSFGVASTLEMGDMPGVEAALVKDLGTSFERDVIETARKLLPAAKSEALERMLNEALLVAPAFTLRGGSTEVLRGVVAKAVLAG